MMLNDENKKSVKKMLSGRSFYVALGVCLLAAGAVGITAMGKNAGKPKSVMPDVTEERVIYSDYDKHIFTDPPTTVPFEASLDHSELYTEPEPYAVFDNSVTALSETETQTEAKKELRFSSPLSLEIGSDYSGGIPVFSPTMSDYRTHNGVDFIGVRGDNVSPIADGTVTAVSKDPVWGNTVTVDHGDGIVSRISGLDDDGIVKEGEYVHENAVIGRVGVVPIESNDTAHIHLEVRKDGCLIDPLELLGFGGSDSDTD